MKILKLISLLMFVLTSQLLISQNEITPKDLKSEIFGLNPSLERILDNMNLLVYSFDVCGESFTWDSLSQQFNFSGSTIIEYDDFGDQKKLTINIQSIVDGETSYIRLINYFSFQELNFNGILYGDSSHIFTGDADGNFQLLTRTVNHYEDEKIILSEEYFNYGALGMINSGLTRFYYDENNFLVAEGRDAFDFASFSLAFSDSSAYINNALGLAVEKMDFEAEFFTGDIVPYNKEEYSYINEIQLEELLGYSYENNAWIKNSKEVLEYDVNGQRTLFTRFESDDNGQTFEPTNRSLSNYEEIIPFNIPSSELGQVMINGEWKNESLSTFENCIIESTQDQFLNINAWIDQNTLYIKDLASEKNAILNLYSMDGHLMLKLKGNQIKELNDVSSLLPGMYILEFRSNDQKGSVKLIKSH